LLYQKIILIFILISSQSSDEERYLSYLQDVTSVKNYYFSYDYHLTLSLQKQYDTQAELGKDLIQKVIFIQNSCSITNIFI
jgi:hypothetical protein